MDFRSLRMCGTLLAANIIGLEELKGRVTGEMAAGVVKRGALHGEQRVGVVDVEEAKPGKSKTEEVWKRRGRRLKRGGKIDQGATACSERARVPLKTDNKKVNYTDSSRRHVIFS